MNESRARRGCIVFAALCLVAACAPPGPASLGGESEGPRDADVIACEGALLALERLIDERSSWAGFPSTVLFEARELHHMGKQLYLEREYSLALEMIEEGIRLIEGVRE